MARGSIIKRCRICRREGLSGYKTCIHKESEYIIVFREGYKQRVETIGPNKKEAERRLNEINTQLANNSFVAPKKIFFKDFVTKWLETYAKPNIKISTYDSYVNTINYHILPSIGHYEISQISTEKIQDLIAKVKQNRSPKTANNVLVLIKTIFKYAYRWDYVSRNPADKVDRIKSNHKEMDFLPPENVRVLLKHAQEPYKTLFMTAIFTGMRLGELLALQWPDIDWGRGVIYVRRSLYWTTKNRDENNQLWRFITPKTRSSYRTVLLTPKLKEVLENHKKTAPISPYELVFCNEEGQPLDPDNIRSRHFKPTLKRAGLKEIRFHDLRHSFVSILIDQGQNIKFISNQVGHASIQTTIDRYGHLLPLETYADAASRLDMLLEENPGTESNKTK